MERLASGPSKLHNRTIETLGRDHPVRTGASPDAIHAPAGAKPVSAQQRHYRAMRLARGTGNTEPGVLTGDPESAECVQRSDDSRNSAIHNAYRISLRPSSVLEPRHPSLKVLIGCVVNHIRSWSEREKAAKRPYHIPPLGGGLAPGTSRGYAWVKRPALGSRLE